MLHRSIELLEAMALRTHGRLCASQVEASEAASENFGFENTTVSGSDFYEVDPEQFFEPPK